MTIPDNEQVAIDPSDDSIVLGPMIAEQLSSDDEEPSKHPAPSIAPQTFDSYPNTEPDRWPVGWNSPSYEEEQSYRTSDRIRYAVIIVVATVMLGGIAIAFTQFFNGPEGNALWGILTVVGSLLVSVLVYFFGNLWGTAVATKVLKGEYVRPLGPLPTKGSGPKAQSQPGVTEAEINRQSLNTYQELTRQQSGSSYRIAQIAIFIGFLILIAGAIVALKADNVTAQIIVASLAALGSAISGYIGATSMRMYQRAQAQMNFYYAQPLVQSYILQAERLSDKLTESRRDASLEKIIDRSLEGASVAGYLIARGADGTGSMKKSVPDPGQMLTPEPNGHPG